MTTLNKIELERLFIAVLALGITTVFAWMIRDYLAALFLAGVIALFLAPLHRWLDRILEHRPKLAAGLLVTGAILAFVIPSAVLLGVVAEQAIDITQRITPWVQAQVSQIQDDGLYGLPDWMPFRETIIQYQTTITTQLGNLAGTVGRLLVSSLRAGTGGFLVATLNVFILVYALYYFLMTGRDSARQALSLLPMTVEDRDLLAQRAISTIRATVKGTFMIAIVQGVLTGAALFVTGVPGAIFWGAVTAPAVHHPDDRPAPRLGACRDLADGLRPVRVRHRARRVGGARRRHVGQSPAPDPRRQGRQDVRPDGADLHPGRAHPLRGRGHHHRPGHRRTVRVGLVHLPRDLFRTAGG